MLSIRQYAKHLLACVYFSQKAVPISGNLPCQRLIATIILWLPNNFLAENWTILPVNK
ncbi:hypothetical protein [Aquirufa beregesia]|uniref:hypothetical protein n=1 Tax=Aquirufa beregesia TaxID=2516556 RepID=UPI0039EE2974